MRTNDQIKSTVDRILSNDREREVQTEQRYQATVARLTGRQEDIVSRYTAAPQPGHGPGKYQPRAQATGRDVVSLFVPEEAFDGSWSDFRRATREAIQWLRENRQCVERGGALCHGPAFELEPSPLAYRDSTGKRWFNASIDRERDFYAAKVQARA